MKRAAAIGFLCFTLGCGAVVPWRGFLEIDDPRWRQYLDQAVDVEYDDVPIPVVFRTGPMKGVNLTPAGSDLTTTTAAFRATGVTRREVLWRIAQQNDLRMTFHWHQLRHLIRMEPRQPRAEPLAILTLPWQLYAGSARAAPSDEEADSAPLRAAREGTCPNGHSTIRRVRLAYGYPVFTPELLKKIDNYEIALGGCELGARGEYRTVCTTCACYTHDVWSFWRDRYHRRVKRPGSAPDE